MVHLDKKRTIWASLLHKVFNKEKRGRSHNQIYQWDHIQGNASGGICKDRPISSKASGYNIKGMNIVQTTNLNAKTISGINVYKFIFYNQMGWRKRMNVPYLLSSKDRLSLQISRLPWRTGYRQLFLLADFIGPLPRLVQVNGIKDLQSK